MWNPIDILFCAWWCNFAPMPEARLNVYDTIIVQEKQLADKEFNHPYINFCNHKKNADLIANFNKPLALKQYKETLIELLIFKATFPQSYDFKPMIEYNQKYLIQKIIELQNTENRSNNDLESR